MMQIDGEGKERKGKERKEKMKRDDTSHYIYQERKGRKTREDFYPEIGEQS